MKKKYDMESIEDFDTIIKEFNENTEVDMYANRVTIRYLRVFAIIALVFACILEVKLYYAHTNKLIEFFINILIGISASSFITYISFIKPYGTKSKNKIAIIEKKACMVYLRCEKVFKALCFSETSLKENKKKKSGNIGEIDIKYIIDNLPSDIDKALNQINQFLKIVEVSKYSSIYIISTTKK